MAESVLEDALEEGNRGEWRGAHVGTSRVDDEVGEALDDANRMTAVVGAEDEDGDVAVVCGLLRPRASSWRRSRVRR